MKAPFAVTLLTSDKTDVIIIGPRTLNEKLCNHVAATDDFVLQYHCKVSIV